MKMATMPSGSGHGWYEAGSWEFGVRLSVPAWFVSIPNVTGTLRLDFAATDAAKIEALEVSIARGGASSVHTGRWRAEVAHLGAVVWQYGTVWRSEPTPYVVAGWPGLIGIIRYSGDDGTAISGTVWCGRVGYDTVTIAYRCAQEREGAMAALVAAILGTVSFSAQPEMPLPPRPSVKPDADLANSVWTRTISPVKGWWLNASGRARRTAAVPLVVVCLVILALIVGLFSGAFAHGNSTTASDGVDAPINEKSIGVSFMLPSTMNQKSRTTSTLGDGAAATHCVGYKNTVSQVNICRITDQQYRTDSLTGLYSGIQRSMVKGGGGLLIAHDEAAYLTTGNISSIMGWTEVGAEPYIWYSLVGRYPNGDVLRAEYGTPFPNEKAGGAQALAWLNSIVFL
jgi:hypothetical protein